MRPSLVRLFNVPRRSLVPRTPSLRFARTMASPAVLASRAVLSSIDLSSQYDPEQSRLMDERCILVDEEDRALGAADKKTCAFSTCMDRHAPRPELTDLRGAPQAT